MPGSEELQASSFELQASSFKLEAPTFSVQKGKGRLVACP
jgi:hypothetical protein